MAGPRVVTKGPSKTKAKRNPQGGAMPSLDSNKFHSIATAGFKAGGGQGFGHTGSSMGGRSR